MVQQHSDLVFRQGGGRLVEHKDAGLLVEGAEDFQQLLLANAERAHRRRRVEVQVKPGQKGGGPLVHRGPVNQAGAQRLAAKKQILGDGQLVDEGKLLGDDGDAGVAGIADAAEARDFSIHQDFPLVGAVRMDAREELDQSGLAGAVLTAERMDLAGPQVERDLAQREDTWEALGQPANFQQRSGHAGGSI